MNYQKIEEDFKEFLSQFHHSGIKEVPIEGGVMTRSLTPEEMVKISNENENKAVKEIARVIIENDEKYATEILKSLTKIAFG